MSYILDALRRADSERERSSVPTLHSQSYGSPPLHGTGRRATLRSPMPWILGAAGVLLALLAWWWLRGTPTTVAPRPTVQAPVNVPAPVVPAPATPAPAAAPSPTVVAVAPPPTSPAPAAQAQPASPTGATAAAPPTSPVPSPAPSAQSTSRAPVAAAPPATSAPPAPSTAPARPPVPTQAAPAPVTPPPARTTPPAPSANPPVYVAGQAPTAAPAAAPPAAATRPSVPPPASTTARAEDRVPRRNELPPEIDRQLPPLRMSGSVYSPEASKRMVIVDGRLMFEGEQGPAGIVVERIQPKSVVLRFQNRRFLVPL
jgi:general secretion pathway protein B